MKIKVGFVSNSSSASFVITWQIPSHIDWKDYIKHAINQYQDCETLKRSGFTDNVNDIINHTEESQLKEGMMTTRIWIVMYNDVDDFGPHIQKFLTQLVVDNYLVKGEIYED